MDEGSCSHPTVGAWWAASCPACGLALQMGGQSLLGVRAGPPFSPHCLLHLDCAVT